MPKLFSPAHRSLVDPSTNRRLLRRPDLRDLWTPRPSAAPLTDSEIDYDEVLIHRAWREFDSDQPGIVRYFMFEFSQKNPGAEWRSAVKAIRFVRLTRVPRYLRQGAGVAGSPNMVFEQQRDVLAALRQEQVLFLNTIVKAPDLPMVYAYGVQAVGGTPEEARAKADEAYAVLTRQLDGTYQQLQYAPLTMVEAEAMARYQAEWEHVAAARGRPLPRGSVLGASALLDGNRTDIENSNNQLESFIRGMSDRSFMLSLVTVPLSPAEMSLAWRNVAEHLSTARSEQNGHRAINAGVALPLAIGQMQGQSDSTTHQSGYTQGVGNTDTVSASQAVGESQSYTQGQATSQTDSLTAGVSQGVSQGVTDSTSQGLAEGRSIGASESFSQGQATSLGTSQSLSLGESFSQSLSQSQSVGVTDTVSAGQNWNQSLANSQSASQTMTQGWNQSLANSLSQAVGSNQTLSESLQNSTQQQQGSNFSGGLGLSGGQNASTTQGQTAGSSNASGLTNTVTGGSSATSGVSGSAAASATQGLTATESAGGSLGRSQGVSNSLSSGLSQTAGQTLSQGLTNSAGLSESLGRTAGLNQGASETMSQQVGRSASLAASESVSQTAGRSVGATASESASIAASRTSTEGASQASSTNQALNDAFAVALARNTGSTGSFGIAPSVGVSISRQTLNAGKMIVGDVLEAQMRRYLEGVESGGWLYQMFLTCPDRETLVGGSGLLKSAFWGAGTPHERLPQPFHVISDLDPTDKERIRTHAALFTSYRKREYAAELIEPFRYSTYVTPGELATMCYPPTAESLGLLAVHDSMPVMAMPSDRAVRDITLGRLVNGERAQVSSQPFGVDINELTHTLVAGVTGSGKTTTLMRLLFEAARVKRKVTRRDRDGHVDELTAPAGILALDWMRNLRNLAQVVEPGRFRFYSMAKPELGAFRWNPLAVPHPGMDPADWRAQQSDNFVSAMNLGEFGRSLIDELIDDLYRANRLTDVVLRPEVRDLDTGAVLREALMLDAIDPASLPEGSIVVGDDGEPVANVYTCPELSRLVGMEHLAVLVAARVEELANPEQARLYGTAMRDRLQSLWRRVQYFAPGAKLTEVFTFDVSLNDRSCLTVPDLIDPDLGLVTVVETDGLDLANRRLILGSVLMAVYRYGLHAGEGVFDHKGKGPGTFVVLEEAHELFGDRREDEDGFSADTRTALYESLFRRSRALGMRLIAVAQNPGDIPEAVTSNTTTVLCHRVYSESDRKRVFSLLNWTNMLGQQQREWRYLGEMAQGYCIARLDAKENFLESAPIQFFTDPAPLPSLDDEDLAAWLERTAANRGG